MGHTKYPKPCHICPTGRDWQEALDYSNPDSLGDIVPQIEHQGRQIKAFDCIWGCPCPVTNKTNFTSYT